MLDQITPLILSYNEAPNIGRTLKQLGWAREVVVVDSYSDDSTVEILSGFPQVRLFQRNFDTHARQWNFGLKETGISSEWVMALDADFVLSPELVEEIKQLRPNAEVGAYRAPFVFCIHGRKLRSAVCPPATLLFRRAAAEFVQDGHTQKVQVAGRNESLSAPVFHDDRKPLSRWLKSQKRYAQLEAAKILHTPTPTLDFADRIRRLRVVAPVGMGLYCLLVRGGILDGRAGVFYAGQRMTAELMLSVFLLGHDLGFRRTQPGGGSR